MNPNSTRPVSVTLYLPIWLYRPLRWIKRKVFSLGTDRNKQTILNLAGDRDIEWSWIASQMPSGPGEVLDFGNGGSSMGLLAARRGFKVTAIDLEPIRWSYRHSLLQFVQGDLLHLDLPKHRFDLIINCSSVEHVGLVGRYSVTKGREDGDLEAMAVLRELMKSDGIMLLTVPVGQDAVHIPWHRVYGKQRLPKLLQGYAVRLEEYWVKNNANCWIPCDRETALSFKSLSSEDGRVNVYALGCFILRPDHRKASS